MVDYGVRAVVNTKRLLALLILFAPAAGSVLLLMLAPIQSPLVMQRHGLAEFAKFAEAHLATPLVQTMRLPDGWVNGAGLHVLSTNDARVRVELVQLGDSSSDRTVLASTESTLAATIGPQHWTVRWEPVPVSEETTYALQVTAAPSIYAVTSLTDADPNGSLSQGGVDLTYRIYGSKDYPSGWFNLNSRTVRGVPSEVIPIVFFAGVLLLGGSAAAIVLADPDDLTVGQEEESDILTDRQSD